MNEVKIWELEKAHLETEIAKRNPQEIKAKKMIDGFEEEESELIDKMNHQTIPLIKFEQNLLDQRINKLIPIKEKNLMIQEQRNSDETLAIFFKII